MIYHHKTFSYFLYHYENTVHALPELICLAIESDTPILLFWSRIPTSAKKIRINNFLLSRFQDQNKHLENRLYVNPQSSNFPMPCIINGRNLVQVDRFKNLECRNTVNPDLKIRSGISLVQGAFDKLRRLEGDIRRNYLWHWLKTQNSKNFMTAELLT